MGIENEYGDQKIRLKKTLKGAVLAPIPLSNYNTKFAPNIMHFLHLYIPLQEIGANKVLDIKINGQALKCTNV